MIIGIGSDIIDIRRIEKVLDRYGERFINRVFTETEQKKSEMRKNRAASYAKRFAAKEACAKALGTGIAAGIWWRDLGVANLPSGKPTMELKGRARSLVERLLPENHDAVIHLTITDDYPWAQALVVIEALPMARAFSGKVEAGFPSENATNLERAFSGKVEVGFPSENATNLERAFSGKVEVGFPFENAIKQGLVPFLIYINKLKRGWQAKNIV